MTKSESQAYARLYNENRVKDEILRSLTRAYREICCYCVEHPEAEIADDPSTNLAASCIEAFFLHRIKGRGARRLASFITGSDQSPLPTSSPDCDINYWQFIRAYIPHKMQLQLVQRPQHQRSEIGCCRAWVRACLNEGSTSSYLAAVLRDRDRICRYFYPNALILDAERREVFVELVKSLDEAEFKLNLRSSLLNYWSSSAAPQLLLPPETDSDAAMSTPTPADRPRNFVHPGLNSLLQRNRSVSMPTESNARQASSDAQAEAAFQRAEASILSGAVADIRRQLDEIRRQQALGRSRRRQPQQQQQQQQLRADDNPFSIGYDVAPSFSTTNGMIGDSLGARVRSEASWSAPPSGMLTSSELNADDNPGTGEQRPETSDEAGDEAGTETSSTAAAAEQTALAATNSTEQQFSQHHHATSWAGLWSSSVDAGAAANAAADSASLDVNHQRIDEERQQTDVDNTTSAIQQPLLLRQHSASAPTFPMSTTRAAEATAVGAAASGIVVSDVSESNGPVQHSRPGSEVGRRGSGRAESKASDGGKSVSAAGSARDSDAHSDSLDWVMLGDDLLIKNDEGYQDLLDLFPGVAQPAFVSSISCPVCLCRLDCSFGLAQSPRQQKQQDPSDQHHQQQQQPPAVRCPVTDRYDGRLYCPDCCPLKSPCPRDILNNWDFTPYPVSVRSFTVLDLIWQHPMIDLSKASPHLYSLQPQLAEVFNLRRQALVLWRYLSACQSNRDISDQFRAYLAGLDYMYDSRLTLHLYSAANLCSVRDGDLRARLAKAVLLARGHVTNCANCRSITARCWICRREDRPILLHELDQYAECVSLNCASVRHPDCGGDARCPRCDTLQRLAIDSLRFDLPDD